MAGGFRDGLAKKEACAQYDVLNPRRKGRRSSRLPAQYSCQNTIVGRDYLRLVRDTEQHASWVWRGLLRSTLQRSRYLHQGAMGYSQVHHLGHEAFPYRAHYEARVPGPGNLRRINPMGRSRICSRWKDIQPIKSEV